MIRSFQLVCLWAFASAYIMAMICRLIGGRAQKACEFFTLLAFAALALSVLVGFFADGHEYPDQGLRIGGDASMIEH